MAAKYRIQHYEPWTIRVDGIEIDIKVKRMDVNEFATFDRLFWRGIFSESDRLVLVRRPGEEMERTTASALSGARLDRVRALADDPAADPRALLQELVAELQPTDQWTIADEEIRRRRLIEMTASQRESYDVLRTKDLESWGVFISQAISDFIRVPPGQIEYEDMDGDQVRVVEVTTGAQLVQCLGGKGDALQEMALAIRHVNTLSDAQKKVLRSRSASTPSSSERDPNPIGASSEPTAASASGSASVTTAAATGPETSRSGATAP